MGPGPGALNPAPGLARYSAAHDEPWRNGRGTTRRLHPAPGAGAGDGWRVSVATLGEAGEFSAFPGVDRVFTPVDAPVDLTVDGRTTRVHPGTPVRFAGEASVTAALPHGPTRAVNVMTERTRCRVTVLVRTVDGPVQPTTALLLLEGEGVATGGERVVALDLVHGPAQCRGSVLEIGVVGAEGGGVVS
ncbi:HutD/Ves family protein [Kineococcus sp. SYSU DK018]|uniref:HutD/Ves family protein n=1 Tax=Kineococcus sp. SYSU DK018 TaxID=3383139 RepID=UPI003D7DA727